MYAASSRVKRMRPDCGQRARLRVRANDWLDYKAIDPRYLSLVVS